MWTWRDDQGDAVWVRWRRRQVGSTCIITILLLRVVFLQTASWKVLAAVLLSHFSLTLYDPIDGSPPGSPVPRILQARTLEWVAISFSNVSKWKVKVKLLSCVWLLATPWAAAYQAPPSKGFSRQEYWSGVPLPSPLTAVMWKIIQIGNTSQVGFRGRGFLDHSDYTCFFDDEGGWIQTEE